MLSTYIDIVFSSSWYWNVLLPRVRSFMSSMNVSDISTRGVASFGNDRINACSAAPRSYRRYTTSFIASQKPRHPPYALKFPIRKFKNHLTSLNDIDLLTTDRHTIHFYLLPVSFGKETVYLDLPSIDRWESSRALLLTGRPGPKHGRGFVFK